MTATPAVERARRASASDAGLLLAKLRSGFGRFEEGHDDDRYQHLLDALDRGEVGQFLVWPRRDPVAVLYVGETATVIPAGDAAAAPAFAAAPEVATWRVLIGDEELGTAVAGLSGRGLFRRTPRLRQQRLMAYRHGTAALEAPEGLRPARSADLEYLTEFACALHVEDLMGPPVPRSGRASVYARMRDSVLAGATWVVERGGAPVAKLDVSLHSRRRGGQIAGVYVAPAWRGHGVAGAAVHAIAARLVAEGLPSVTLHVRSDNEAALRAYRRAGFHDRCAWVLALR